MAFEKPVPSLGMLPLELIEMINQHMDVIDQLCMALCNRWLFACNPQVLYWIWGQFYRVERSVHDLRLEDEENKDYNEQIIKEFLTRLDVTDPRWFLCKGCERLHRVQDAEAPHPFSEKPICSKATESWRMPFMLNGQSLPLSSYPTYAAHKIFFVHVQLAMREFRLGPGCGISLEALSYKEAGIFPAGSHPAFSHRYEPNMESANLDKEMSKTIFSVDARASTEAPSPSLILRVQELCLVREDCAHTLLPQAVNMVRICWHMNSQVSNINAMVCSLFGNYWSGKDGNMGWEGRCPECNTSWHIQVRAVDHFGGVCLVITRWIDLGFGNDPEDPHWRALVEPRFQLAPLELAQDPRKRFEGLPDTKTSPSEEDQFFKNLDLLVGLKFLAVMSRLDMSRWYQTFV
ncbi:hypothetical protein N7456_004576 [Penicillium angulare]|uniref:F-box domain-containing protein n=1 Tax=Penicillium angulare TaxID=116970 RepID=A0A9W9FWV2_9EURO|nr:hypothetical protein N7456_004576 [Penicillium angulare]